MCTLVLAWQVLADGALAVAANRDEQLSRPARPPDRYADAPAVVAPTDSRAGGTWIGINEHGVVVGILNRWGANGLAGERSRGKLVADALEAGTAQKAVDTVTEQLKGIEYEGFFLVVADATSASFVGWNGETTVRQLDPGIHVAVNVGIDGDTDDIEGREHIAEQQATNARRLRSTLAAGSDETVDAWLERAGTVLGDHDYGVCIHRDGFGTRSSSLIGVADRPTYAYADGPPCRTPYEAVALEGHL